jgi:hypothetical protein
LKNETQHELRLLGMEYAHVCCDFFLNLSSLG